MEEVEEAETKLSKFSSNTADPEEFMEYLKSKSECDCTTKLFDKKFVVTVDEFRTSSICSVCHYKLEQYRKRDGKLFLRQTLLQEMWTREKAFRRQR